MRASFSKIRSLFVLDARKWPIARAGAVMTTDYATLAPTLTVREAIDRLRLEAPDRETIYYSYVVDLRRRLIGLVSLKSLILARLQRRRIRGSLDDPLFSPITS